MFFFLKFFLMIRFFIKSLTPRFDLNKKRPNVKKTRSDFDPTQNDRTSNNPYEFLQFCWKVCLITL